MFRLAKHFKNNSCSQGMFHWLISNVCLRGSVQNKIQRLSKWKDIKHCSRESFQVMVFSGAPELVYVRAHSCRVCRIHFLDPFNLLCFSNQVPKALPGDWTHSYLRVQTTHSPVPSLWENLTFQKRCHAQKETWQTSPSQATAHPWTASNIFGRICKQRFPIILPRQKQDRSWCSSGRFLSLLLCLNSCESLKTHFECRNRCFLLINQASTQFSVFSGLMEIFCGLTEIHGSVGHRSTSLAYYNKVL